MRKTASQKGAVTRRDFLKISLLGTAILAPGLCSFFQNIANSLFPGREPAIPQTSAGWVKSKFNPVLGGSLGTCFDVSVLKEADVYRMWFSWRPRKSIALVESADGIHWNEPLIVLGPEGSSGWEEDVNRPAVLRQADGYHMWYTGQTEKNSYLGYAKSPDGRVWTRVSRDPVLSPDEAWEGAAVMCPDVLYDPSQMIFRMWYSAGSQYEPISIGYALSSDGVHWTKRPENPVFSSDAQLTWERDRVTASHVVQDGEWHIMFYIGFSDLNHAQIGIARSKDGVTNWQRHKANPVISPGIGSWDGDAVYKPSALFDKDRWMLWYNGRRGGVEQIGLATHEGRDLNF
jgi:hypothetical protein